MIFPSASETQRMISCSPSRANTYARSPLITGEEWPSPTGMLHFFESVSAVHDAGALTLAMMPSRLGPRHWFQSVANAGAAARHARIACIPLGEGKIFIEEQERMR